MRADVLLVQGQVILLQVMGLLWVLVKVLVVGLEEVLLASLSLPHPPPNATHTGLPI